MAMPSCQDYAAKPWIMQPKLNYAAKPWIMQPKLDYAAKSWIMQQRLLIMWQLCGHNREVPLHVLSSVRDIPRSKCRVRVQTHFSIVRCNQVTLVNVRYRWFTESKVGRIFLNILRVMTELTQLLEHEWWLVPLFVEGKVEKMKELERPAGKKCTSVKFGLCISVRESCPTLRKVVRRAEGREL